MENPAHVDDVDIDMDDVDIAPEDDGDLGYLQYPKYYQSRRRRNTIITNVYLQIKTTSFT